MKKAQAHNPRATTDLDILLGENIAICRKEAHLSMEEIAGDLGISYQQFQKYEGGKNRIAAIRLYDLSQVLNVSITTLYRGFPNVSQTPEKDVSTKEFVKLLALYNRLKNKDLRQKAIRILEALQD